MKTIRTNSYLYAVILAVSLVAPASLQAGFACTASVGVAPLVRVEGDTEPVGDIVLTCTGGSPTTVGSAVPQVAFTIFLSTNLTSHVTASTAAVNFSEALLLVDEPNSIVSAPQRPLLNCGQNGAPDNGLPGPGVCSIISDGTAADTYDGTQNTYGLSVCAIGAVPPPNSYGCGRPNAFQARLGTPTDPGALNAVTFLGVPVDPSGAGTRIFRFTNLRANAALIGLAPPPMVSQIHAFVSVTGSTVFPISGPDQIVGFIEPGLVAQIPSAGVVRVTEGFASAFKDRNVSFTVGNGGPGNAVFVPPNWVYNGGLNYPPDLAQNIPGTIYNTESLFQWQNDSPNGPPSPNPPPGFGSGTVLNLGTPLDSLAFGGVNTGIDQDGVVSAGTRIALSFDHLTSGATMDCPSIVHLQRAGTTGPVTGVMVLTTTDTNGAGAFSPAINSSTAAGNLSVYEVLYVDPFSLQFADIACTLNLHGHGGGPGGIRVTPSFAPFYSSPGAGRPTPTAADPVPTALPRFQPGTISLHLH